MTGAEDTHKGFGFGSGPILMGLLGLQLILLAFFILLVSMSSFDTHRVRSVLDSVQGAFSETPAESGDDDEAQRADAIALAGIVDEIEGVLVSALQLDRVERTGEGAIAFDLPADALFAAGTAQLLPARGDVFARLVAALDRRPAGYRYDLELLVGRLPAATDDAASLPMLEIDRAGVLARALRDAGAQESGLAAGLLPNAPDKLRIVINLTDQPRIHGLFAPGAPAGSATETSGGDGR
jgi:hypothetical protein